MDSAIQSKPEPHLGMHSSSLYFSTLPSEILPVIIVFLNARLERPYMEEEEEEGEDFESSRKKRERILTVSVLFSDDGPFHNAVSAMFSEIQLTPHYLADPLYEVNLDTTFTIRHDMFENEVLENSLPVRILQVCYQSVKKVVIYVYGGKTCDEDLIVQQFALLVRMYCPVVEQLVLESYAYDGPRPQYEDFIPELFVQFSSKLRSIEWKVNTFPGCIDYFPNISMCTDIKELFFPASVELISFLNTGGSSLEKRSVLSGDNEESVQVFDAIELNCRKLTKLWFTRRLNVIVIVGEERYAKLLCSYGPQLTKAEVGKLSMEKFVQVMRACPNLLIDSYYMREHGIGGWERLRQLESIISSLSISIEACVDEKCGDAIVRCTNLKQLSISRHAALEREIDAGSELRFLSSLLRSSIIDFEHKYFTLTQRNITMIASAAWNLRSLRLNLLQSIEVGINFKVITDLNQELSTIAIYERNEENVKERTKDSTLDVVEMLVKAFAKCRSIHFTLLNRSNEIITHDGIRDICGFLPCRGVTANIEVGSIWYTQGPIYIEE